MLGLGEAGDEVLQAMKSIKHSISVSQSIYNSSNTYTYKYFVDKIFLSTKGNSDWTINFYTAKHNTGCFVVLAVLAEGNTGEIWIRRGVCVENHIMKTKLFEINNASWLSCGFRARVFLKHKSNMAGDCYFFKSCVWRSVDWV